MSFLAGRLAASEGAYFKETSKSALVALKQNLEKSGGVAKQAECGSGGGEHADVLPEVLRHSVPLVVTPAEVAASESLPESTSLAAVAARSAVQASAEPARLDVTGQRIFVAVPQTALGPRKWEIDVQAVKVVPSTANAARTDVDDTHSLKDAVEGYLSISKAFFVATALVFGGGTLAVGVTASRLQMNTFEDVRTKGKELMRPRVEAWQNRFEPVKIWAHELSGRVRRDEDRQHELGAGFGKAFGVSQDRVQSVSGVKPSFPSSERNDVLV